MRDDNDSLTADLLADNTHQTRTSSLQDNELPQQVQPYSITPDARTAQNSTNGDELQQRARQHAEQVAKTHSGYKLINLHTHRLADGTVSHWVVRLKNSQGEKRLLPFAPIAHFTSDRLAELQAEQAEKLNKTPRAKPFICADGFINREPCYQLVYPAGNGKKPLYTLDRISTAPAGQPVWFLEGQQKADAINQMGGYATTGGACSSISNLDLSPLADRHVIIWPDHDAAGLKMADELSPLLHAMGCTVEMIDTDLLKLPEAGDIVDWISAQNKKGLNTTLDDIQTLQRNAYTPKPENATASGSSDDDSKAAGDILDDDTIHRMIAELAGLSLVSYERRRKGAAEALDIRPSVLDKLVTAARKEIEADQSGDELFAEVTPCADPVDGAALLEQIRQIIDRHIACEPSTTTATALWIMFTWCIDAVQVAPLACITAPEKRCGKTQLLTLIGKMAYRPLPASSITPAALFRSIEKWQPTLLIDEADSFIGGNEDLRGLLNAGHSRDQAYAIRTTGDNHEPTPFLVWGAKAISGIGHLPDTLKDRSILLELRRKEKNEHRQRIRHADPAEFDLIRSQLCRWAQDNMESLRHARPELPDALNDRAQDNWEPLLAIADQIGGDWPQRARNAALSVSGIEDYTPSIKEELLADIKAIFNRTGKPKIYTDDLLTDLCMDTEQPWATFNKGKPITARQLSRMLGEFGVKSKTVRIGSGTQKGYDINDLADSFNRYLSNTPFLSVTSSQPSDIKACSDFFSVTAGSSVTDQKTLQPSISKACDGVTHKTPQNGKDKKTASVTDAKLSAGVTIDPVKNEVVL